jgi:hypothetical protein
MANPEWDNYRQPLNLIEVRAELQHRTFILPAGAEKVCCEKLIEEINKFFDYQIEMRKEKEKENL